MDDMALDGMMMRVSQYMYPERESEIAKLIEALQAIRAERDALRAGPPRGLLGAISLVIPHEIYGQAVAYTNDQAANVIEIARQRAINERLRRALGLALIGRRSTAIDLLDPTERQALEHDARVSLGYILIDRKDKGETT